MRRTRTSLSAGGPRRARRSLGSDSSAAAQTLTFLIALAVFVPAFALLILFTQDQGDSSKSRTADLDTKARLSLDLIVSHSGARSDNGATNWEDLEEPHEVSQVGLRDEQGHALDYDKVRRLQGGELGRDPADGKLNYAEFKDALGIGSRYDFHLRAYPIFEANAGNRYGTNDLPDLRAAYVGDYLPNTWNVVTGTALEDSGAAGLEVPALDGLNLDFAPVPYRPEVLPLGLTLVDGDVYPDLADDIDGLPGSQPYLDQFFLSRIGLYDIVVVGSEVDQVKMNPHKDILTDFVHGGGVVIALGSEAMSPSWANGLLKVQAGQVQGNKLSGALTTPDDSHALLTTPNRLDHAGYGFAANKWTLHADEEFALILAYPEDAQSNRVPTELAVSNDGYYGEGGTVFLSNLNVYELPLEERFKVLANELIYVYLRSVFIDFGPELDEDALARSATRILPIEAKSGKLVDAKILMYVWRAG